MADKWYNDTTLVATFGSVLSDAGVLEDQDDFKQFLKKPFKYNEFYTAWEAAGYPEEDDDAWDEFVELVSSDDESDEDEDESDETE